MTMNEHHLSEVLLDPVPATNWRNCEPLPSVKVGFCDICGFIHADPYPHADFLSAYYSTYEMPTSQANLAETARFLATTLPKAATVLDIGCGDG